MGQRIYSEKKTTTAAGVSWSENAEKAGALRFFRGAAILKRGFVGDVTIFENESLSGFPGLAQPRLKGLVRVRRGQGSVDVDVCWWKVCVFERGKVLAC